ncbi:MAG: hypothetical protein PHV43_03130 [Candidatus Colwellbacteria bacterium]|nr:hypothetical protein [Candidatus Colwellbacteria bacterium]
MSFSLNFVFSFLTLALGVFASFYFFINWLCRHKKCTFLVIWALALLLFYWFKIPGILSDAGLEITLTDFSEFFVVTYFIYFIAHILVYLGIMFMGPGVNSRRIGKLFILWSGLAFLFFLTYFLIEGLEQYMPLWLSVIFFYLPIQLLILSALYKWFRRRDVFTTKRSLLGVFSMILSFFLLAVSSIFYLINLLANPSIFWFAAVTFSYSNSLLQTLGVLFLVAGMLLVHGECCQIVRTISGLEERKSN